MIRLRGNFLVPTAPDPDNAGVGTQIFFIFAFIIRPHFLDVFFLPRPPVVFKVVKLKNALLSNTGRQRPYTGVFMKASVAIQVLPKADSDEELCRIVDEVIAYIKSTGLNYFVGPCETAIEGDDYNQLMEIVKNCQLVAIKAGAPSVSAYVKIGYRPNGEVLSIEKKTKKFHEK